MQPTEEFNGLGMPVFTAFGWAGEEAAQNYALSQLEQFVAQLHENMPPDLQSEMPFHGLRLEDRNAYLASGENVEDDAYITFNVRPVSLEIQLTLTDKTALARALKKITENPAAFLLLLQMLDPDWTLRLQQIRIEEESGDQGHYQELFKGDISELDKEKIVEIFEKAAYLNGESQWVTPIYLSQRIPAEQASAMQQSIVPVMAERLGILAPIVAVLRGRSAKKQADSQVTAKKEVESKPEPTIQPTIPAPIPELPADSLTKEELTYTSELKPLHLQRGFINLTPEYWPFFALNARTESRPVIVITTDVRDEDSAVWRLQPNDLARLVLGAKAHRWLEDNFVPGDYVQLKATKLGDSEIQIVLDPLS